MEQMTTTMERQVNLEEQERAAQYAAQIAVAGVAVQERWNAPINIQNGEAHLRGHRQIEDAAYMAGGVSSFDVAVAIYAAAHEEKGAERILQALEAARLAQPVEERVQGPMLPAAMLEQAVADRLQFNNIAAMSEQSRIMFERQQNDLFNHQDDEDEYSLFGSKTKKKKVA